MAATLAALAVLARSQIERRDAAITALQQSNSDLTSANLRLQEELRAVTDERQSLLGERAKLIEERDDLTGRLTDTTNQKAELEAKLSDTQNKLSEANQQLAQARQESSQQQNRAQTAEARNAAMATVLRLDEQIQQEFMVFLNEFATLADALLRRDFWTAQAAYNRAERSANRLRDLLQQRDAAAARL